MSIKKSIWNFWSTRYNNLWVQRWSLTPTRETIMTLLKPLLLSRGHTRILDVGCGTGQLLRQLEAAYGDDKVTLCGIDFSRGMIEEARRELNRTELICCDVLSIPEMDKVDVILATHTLPYYKNPLAAIKHLTSRLSKDGLLIIANASRSTIYDRMMMPFVKITTGPAFYPSKTQLQDMLYTCFESVSVSEILTRRFVPTLILAKAQNPQDEGL